MLNLKECKLQLILLNPLNQGSREFFLKQNVTLLRYMYKMITVD